MNKKKIMMFGVIFMFLAACGKETRELSSADTSKTGANNVSDNDVEDRSVPLSAENFPDASFRELLSALIDDDSDGILSQAERESLIVLQDTIYSDDEEEIEAEGEKESVMAELLPQVENFTGIEYFANLKVIRICCQKGSKLQGLNLQGLSELEELDIRMADSEGIYGFQLKDLPQLQRIRIETQNPKSLCEIKLDNIKNLKEFRLDGNIEKVSGLEQSGVEKIVLKMDEAVSVKDSADTDEVRAITYDLSEFTSLRELHIYANRKAEKIEFVHGAALETLAVEASCSAIILRDMPKLRDMRMLGGCAIQSENCDELVCLRVAKCGRLDCLDLSSLSSLKLLEIVWTTMDVKELILPNDMVDIADRRGTVKTEIVYKEQPFWGAIWAMSEEACSAVEARTELACDVVNYEEVDATILDLGGIYEFVCMPEHGYRIDLDNDGIKEELYADEQDFYINGIGQGIARGAYVGNAVPWQTFWLVVPEKSDEMLYIILNTAARERYCMAVQNQDEFNPRYYWMSDYDMDWGGYNEECFIPEAYVGQCLMYYDGVLQLQAYAEGSFTKSAQVLEGALCYPFIAADYSDSGEITFRCKEGERIRIYGGEKGASCFIQEEP